MPHFRRDERTAKEPEYPVSSPWESVTSIFSSTSSSKAQAWLDDPLVVGVASALGATALTIGGLAGYRRYWRRIRNSDYVTSGMLDKKRWVRGVVTRSVAT